MFKLKYRYVKKKSIEFNPVKIKKFEVERKMALFISKLMNTFCVLRIPGPK